MSDKRVCIQILANEELFDDQYTEKHKTPKYEVVSCSVPYTRKQPDNEEVQDCPCRAFSATAERNVDILSKP